MISSFPDEHPIRPSLDEIFEAWRKLGAGLEHPVTDKCVTLKGCKDLLLLGISNSPRDDATV